MLRILKTIFFIFVIISISLTSLFSATHYVNPTTASTDWSASQNIATPCTPLTAFQNAVAGDTVYFLAGTYNTTPHPESPGYHARWEPVNSGTQASPIVFAANPGDNVIINGVVSSTTDMIYVFSTGRKDYIVFDGFRIQANGGVKMGAIIIGLDTGNFDDTSGYTQGCVVRNCVFDGGTDIIVSTDNREMLRMEWTISTLVQNCVFYNGKHSSYNHNTSAIKMYHNKDVIIENCELYNTNVAIFDKSDGNHTVIRNNFIHDNSVGLEVTSFGWTGFVSNHPDMEIYNNIFARHIHMAISNATEEYSSTDYTTVFNNIFYSTTTVASNSVSLAGGKEQKFFNNIFYGKMRDADVGVLRWLWGNNAENVPAEISECDHNQFGGNVFRVKIKYDAYTSLSAWQASTVLKGGGSPGVGSLDNNPNFANLSGNMASPNDFAVASHNIGRNGQLMGPNDVSKVGVITGGVAKDVTAPTIPTLQSAVAEAYNKVLVKWSRAEDDRGVFYYRIYRNSTLVSEVPATRFSYLDDKVIASTTYNYNIRAVDSDGNESALSNTLNVTTPSSTDTEKPTKPQITHAASASSSKNILRWNSSTDNVEVIGYNIYRNNVLIVQTNALEYFDESGLSPSTTYSYSIRAFDAGNNLSDSASANITTLATSYDSQPPTVSIKGPVAGAKVSGTVTVAANAWDNVNVKKVIFYCNGTPIYDGERSEKKPFFTPFWYTSTLPDGSYQLTAKAIDDYGNETVSAPVTVYVENTKTSPKTIYVDKTLPNNITNGTYSILNRNSSGSDGDAYNTLKSGIYAMKGGDTLVLRGGVYKEGHIHLDITRNGTESKYTTIKSFKGEWAVLDGENGGGDGGIDNMTVGVNGFSGADCVLGYVVGGNSSGAADLKYWRFERLEIRNGVVPNGEIARAFYGEGGPFIWRYCYIHDNEATTGSFVHGGLTGSCWNNSVVEYCLFERNGYKGGAHLNCAHIIMTTDYKWDVISRDGYTAWENVGHHQINNQFRYNIFRDATSYSFKEKSTQLFTGRNYAQGHGYSEHNDAYKNFGNKLHHNIVIGGKGFAPHQDFVQVYNNIFDNSELHFGVADEIGLYKNVAYNNTVINGHIMWYHVGRSVLPSYEKDYFGYGFNNIIDSSPGAQGVESSNMGCYMPSSLTDLVFNNFMLNKNYFYRTLAASNKVIYIGNRVLHNPNHLLTVAEYENKYPGTDLYINDYNSADPLFVGTTGAGKYLTRACHILEGNKTISNGGMGISHQYLDGVTLPSYIGAANPESNAWVQGVLDLGFIDVNGIPVNLRDAPDGDPDWLDKTILEKDKIQTVKLSPNYPNPFSSKTYIKYTIPSTLTNPIVSVKIYNILGQEVCTLVNKIQAPNSYTIEWNAINYSSGIYFCRVSAIEKSQTYKDVIKMVLVK